MKHYWLLIDRKWIKQEKSWFVTIFMYKISLNIMKDSLIIFFQTFHYLLPKKTCCFNECHKDSSRMFLSHLKSCKNILIEEADFAIYFLIQKMLPYELHYDYIMIMDSNEHPKQIWNFSKTFFKFNLCHELIKLFLYNKNCCNVYLKRFCGSIESNLFLNIL